jgi:chromosome partitioning protein
MRKIVIANQKGGVAKTTTAVNLANGLAMSGYQTLLIDMDPQANATFAILGSQELQCSTYDLLIRDEPIIEVIRSTRQANLDIVPSHIDLAGAEVELISRVGGQTRLRTKTNELAETPIAQKYEYLIIDAPPSLGFLTINSLAAAEEVFLPVSASVFALNGIAMLEDTIRQVRRELNCPQLHISGVLCTMYEDTNVAKDVFAQIQEYFGHAVFKTVIRKNIKLEEAHSRAESIFTYAADSKGAEGYRELVKEVISRE